MTDQEYIEKIEKILNDTPFYSQVSNKQRTKRFRIKIKLYKDYKGEMTKLLTLLFSKEIVNQLKKRDLIESMTFVDKKTKFYIEENSKNHIILKSVDKFDIVTTYNILVRKLFWIYKLKFDQYITKPTYWYGASDSKYIMFIKRIIKERKKEWTKALKRKG